MAVQHTYSFINNNYRIIFKLDVLCYSAAPSKYEDAFSAGNCVMGDGNDAASPSYVTRARTDADADHATLDG